MTASPSVAFNPPPFDSVADVRKYVVLRDDFVGGDATSGTVGELGWTVTDVAAGGADVDLISTAATVQGHPGVVQLNTGPTTPIADDEGVLHLPNLDGLILNDATLEHFYGCWVVRFPSVTSVESNVGFFDAADAGRSTNGISVELDASVGATFQLVVVDAGTPTVVDTGLTAAIDTWYAIEIAAHEDEVQARINGANLTVAVGANIPDDEGLAPAFKVATETTAEKSLLVDAFMFRAKVSR